MRLIVLFFNIFVNSCVRSFQISKSILTKLNWILRKLFWSKIGLLKIRFWQIYQFLTDCNWFLNTFPGFNIHFFILVQCVAQRSIFFFNFLIFQKAIQMIAIKTGRNLWIAKFIHEFKSFYRKELWTGIDSFHVALNCEIYERIFHKKFTKLVWLKHQNWINS